MAEKIYIELDYPIIPAGDFHIVKAENVGWGEDDLDDVLQGIEDYLEMHDGNIKNIDDSISGLDTRVTALEESKGTVIKIKGRVNTVDDLPANASAGDMYFVGTATAEQFEEYVFTEQGRWEYLGSINDVDLSDYVTKSFLSNTLGEYAKLSDIPTVPANYLTGGSQTSKSTADGGKNVYTFTKSDGTTSTLEVLNGSKGSKGDTGAQGPQGEQGIQGIQGPKGDTGAKGSTGATGPAGSDGVSCTHSWNGTTLTVTSASGTSSANLKGAKGDTGDTGPQGKQGIQGIQGPKGDKGDTGATGATGPQGPKGDTGATGPQGPQGVKGDTGPQGEQGIQGPKGDTGAKGSTGATGPAGADGISCTHSWNGTTLTVTSASGTSSANLKGATGATGPQGPAGQNATTTAVATTSANGLMSKDHVTKLNGIATGATAVSESTVSGWGFTKNAGTVTQVKVGSTAYNPSSGVVSLPAYPTTLPASDVSAWAKAANKPTYTASDVGALPADGIAGTANTLSTFKEDGSGTYEKSRRVYAKFFGNEIRFVTDGGTYKVSCDKIIKSGLYDVLLSSDTDHGATVTATKTLSDYSSISLILKRKDNGRLAYCINVPRTFFESKTPIQFNLPSSSDFAFACLQTDGKVALRNYLSGYSSELWGVY